MLCKIMIIALLMSFNHIPVLNVYTAYIRWHSIPTVSAGLTIIWPRRIFFLLGGFSFGCTRKIAIIIEYGCYFYCTGARWFRNDKLLCRRCPRCLWLISQMLVMVRGTTSVLVHRVRSEFSFLSSSLSFLFFLLCHKGCIVFLLYALRVAIQPGLFILLSIILST